MCEAKGRKSCILISAMPSVLHVTLDKFPPEASISLSL